MNKDIIRFLNRYKDDSDPQDALLLDGKCKQSFRAVLCTLIYISTFVPNLNFGQDEHFRLTARCGGVRCKG